MIPKPLEFHYRCKKCGIGVIIIDNKYPEYEILCPQCKQDIKEEIEDETE